MKKRNFFMGLGLLTSVLSSTLLMTSDGSLNAIEPKNISSLSHTSNKKNRADDVKEICNYEGEYKGDWKNSKYDPYRINVVESGDKVGTAMVFFFGSSFTGSKLKLEMGIIHDFTGLSASSSAFRYDYSTATFNDSVDTTIGTTKNKLYTFDVYVPTDSLSGTLELKNVRFVSLSQIWYVDSDLILSTIEMFPEPTINEARILPTGLNDATFSWNVEVQGVEITEFALTSKSFDYEQRWSFNSLSGSKTISGLEPAKEYSDFVFEIVYTFNGTKKTMTHSIATFDTLSQYEYQTNSFSIEQTSWSHFEFSFNIDRNVSKDDALLESAFQLRNGSEMMVINLLNHDLDTDKLTFEAKDLPENTKYSNLQLSVNFGKDFHSVGSVSTDVKPDLPEIINVSIDQINADSFQLNWEVKTNDIEASEFKLTSKAQNFTTSWNFDANNTSRIIHGLNPNSTYDDLVLELFYTFEGKEYSSEFALDPITTIESYEYHHESFEILQVADKSFTFKIEANNNLLNKNILSEEFVLKTNNQIIDLRLNDHAFADSKSSIVFEAFNLEHQTIYTDFELSVNGGKDFHKIDATVETLELIDEGLAGWEIYLITISILVFLALLLIAIILIYRLQKNQNEQV